MLSSISFFRLARTVEQSQNRAMEIKSENLRQRKEVLTEMGTNWETKLAIGSLRKIDVSVIMSHPFSIDFV